MFYLYNKKSIIFLLFFILGCMPPEEKMYSVTILCKKSNFQTEKMPEELYPIFYPLTGDFCPDYTYRASKATIKRVDLQQVDSLQFEITPGLDRKSVV